MRLFVCGLLLFSLFFAGGMVLAQEEEEDDPVEFINSIKRKTPSDKYTDPESFFRMHGYVSLSYAEAGDELGADPYRAPHILVSGVSPETGKNESGFKNDAALFVGGEPFDGVGANMELHFVGNALDPVLTEAKLTWDIKDPMAGRGGFRFHMGRYWWPFGIHNEEWFSAVNNFTLVSPVASEVVPAHVNEVGIMAEGESKVNKTLGLNYVLSMGNGVSSFQLPDAVRGTSFDNNGDRTLTGRLGFAARGNADLDFGFSAASGKLREEGQTGFPDTDARTYPGEFNAYGLDLVIEGKSLRLRSYYMATTEELTKDGLDELERDGFTLEPSFSKKLSDSFIREFAIVGRYSSANEDRLAGGTAEYVQFGLSLRFQVTNALHLKLNYLEQEEEGVAAELDNEIFSLGITAEF